MAWTNTFLLGGRAERAITVRQAMARVVIEDAGGQKLLRAAPHRTQSPAHPDAATYES
jgi:hypothetical protein